MNVENFLKYWRITLGYILLGLGTVIVGLALFILAVTHYPITTGVVALFAVSGWIGYLIEKENR